MRHVDGLKCAVQPFHEAIGCVVVGCRPAEVVITHHRQAVEELRFQLACLGDRDCTPQRVLSSRKIGLD